MHGGGSSVLACYEWNDVQAVFISYLKTKSQKKSIKKRRISIISN